MAGYAVHRVYSSSGSKQSKFGVGTVYPDVQHEVLEMLRESIADLGSHSATSCARLQDLSISSCMRLIAELPGFEAGSPN